MHSISSTDYALQFPFSKDVSTHIDALIQKNISKINEDAQILQNNATTSGITTGMAYCCGLQLVCQHPFLFCYLLLFIYVLQYYSASL